MQTAPIQTTPMRPSPNRLIAVVVGAAYVLLGIAGFVVTSGRGFFAADGGLLLGLFELNAAQNVLHILAGAALLMAGLSRPAAARPVNAWTGAVFLVLGLAGLFLVGSPLDILAINVADNVVHFGTAAVLLAVGLGARESEPSR